MTREALGADTHTSSIGVVASLARRALAHGKARGVLSGWACSASIAVDGIREEARLARNAGQPSWCVALEAKFAVLAVRAAAAALLAPDSTLVLGAIELLPLVSHLAAANTLTVGCCRAGDLNLACWTGSHS